MSTTDRPQWRGGRVGEASGIGEEEVCVGEASVLVSGKSKYAVKRTGTAEYPWVKRLRERRLLSFLRDQGFHGAFELIDKTPVIFRVRHIRLLVQQGRWADALRYLNTYLPPLSENHKRSCRAQIFHNFRVMHYRFRQRRRRQQGKAPGKALRKELVVLQRSSHAELKFRSIAYTILASEPHQLMATYDWDEVRRHASFLVDYLAHTTPELSRSMPLPSRYMMPQHALPIGSGLHRRGHRVLKKQGPQKPDTDAILMALKSVAATNGAFNYSAESPNDALEMLADFLDQTFQAGLRRGCNLSYASEPTEKEAEQVAGGADAPDVQSMLGSSTDNAEGHATSSVIFSVAPFFQMISSGALKVHSQNPGISSVTNAGANKRLVQAGCHTENPSKESTAVEDDIYPKKSNGRLGR
ncbi:hypothetical protein ACQ4PT_014902 [Festuca glaucescens]